MCMTDEKLVDAYGKGDPRERFMLIYRNYEVFPQLIDCYELGLFNRILYEKEYNRRKKNGDDLGVRIQTSKKSDPTAKLAVEHVMIRDAIKECNFSGELLKDTDNSEKHRRDILTIHMMRREYEVFDNCLKTLPGREYRITYHYIHGDLDTAQLAEQEHKADQTIRNMLAKTRRVLESRTTPFFREEL